MASHRRERAGDDGWSRWVQPVERGYKLSCCDCGLVHDFDFRVEEGRAQFKVRRNARSTAAVRREKAKAEVRRADGSETVRAALVNDTYDPGVS